ncbi:MAG: hypothetical protein AB3N22_20770 [Ruegeria sp.]
MRNRKPHKSGLVPNQRLDKMRISKFSTRIWVVFVSLLYCFVFSDSALAQKVNYKTTALSCEFKEDCGDGEIRWVDGRRLDTSSCQKVNFALLWNPSTGEFKYRGKRRQVLSTELRRRSASVNTYISGDYVNFSVGRRLLPALRFRKESNASSPITKMLFGSCQVVN